METKLRRITYFTQLNNTKKILNKYYERLLWDAGNATDVGFAPIKKY